MTTGKHTPVKPQDIENLIEIFKQSDWDEMHVQVGDFELFLSNDPNATGPARAAPAGTAPVALTAAAPAAPTAKTSTAHAPVTEAPIPDGMLAIRAPNLGTFYRAPKPGAPPYVEIGQHIDADTEVCLIEVMKLFAPVCAGIKGTVREVRAQDGMMVEFDQILFIVEPAA
ncbi:MAG TPA: acetyl-CoA carboxylase biotin carboxyl carrier protein [Gammaproteobacteria bacterium]|nr:acetyl-CoA carboxylase biotin carboxyl carrier protein [Gammaproteobacteria bacterium]